MLDCIRYTADYIRKLFYKQIEITVDKVDAKESTKDVEVGSYLSRDVYNMRMVPEYNSYNRSYEYTYRSFRETQTVYSPIYKTVPTHHGKIIDKSNSYIAHLYKDKYSESKMFMRENFEIGSKLVCHKCFSSIGFVFHGTWIYRITQENDPDYYRGIYMGFGLIGLSALMFFGL